MRFYKIAISDPDSGSAIQTFASANDDGSTNPAAADIELDIPVSAFAVPLGGAFARVWGVPLQQISQASDLNNKSIEITVGMAKGLPLANPAQQGVVVRGTIFPAFGNWIDTDQTLDLLLAPPLAAPIVHNWPKGQQLGGAIKQALQSAFPGYTVNANLSSKVVLPENDLGIYPNIVQYATYLNAMSKRVNQDKGYPGVNITVSGKTITIYDGTQPIGNTVAIQFADLIGQPTWIGTNTISLKTVMRGDIQVGQMVTLPQAQITTTGSSQSQFRNNSAFQGSFLVTAARHVGRYRQEDANSWVSVFEVVSGAAG